MSITRSSVHRRRSTILCCMLVLLVAVLSVSDAVATKKRTLEVEQEQEQEEVVDDIHYRSRVHTTVGMTSQMDEDSNKPDRFKNRKFDQRYAPQAKLLEHDRYQSREREGGDGVAQATHRKRAM